VGIGGVYNVDRLASAALRIASGSLTWSRRDEWHEDMIPSAHDVKASNVDLSAALTRSNDRTVVVPSHIFSTSASRMALEMTHIWKMNRYRVPVNLLSKSVFFHVSLTS